MFMVARQDLSILFRNKLLTFQSSFMPRTQNILSGYGACGISVLFFVFICCVTITFPLLIPFTPYPFTSLYIFHQDYCSLCRVSERCSVGVIPPTDRAILGGFQRLYHMAHARS